MPAKGWVISCEGSWFQGSKVNPSQRGRQFPFHPSIARCKLILQLVFCARRYFINIHSTVAWIAASNNLNHKKMVLGLCINH